MFEFLSNFSPVIIASMFLVLLLCVYFFREKKIVKQIIVNAICEAEIKFNSGEGQKKLDYAVSYIKGKLPRYLSFLISKSILVTLIEHLLNKGLQMVDVDKTVDIKGNEGIEVIEKMNLNINKLDNSVEMCYNIKDDNSIDSDKAEIYGSLKMKTDWHDKPNTTIELGIKKKI